mmetsp:Transcript_18672/g.59313  ORF Transcript_18672/g.59313 Transcript_18672/m.59313 type:complete len:230 (+) Transcript_18672:668-1357(+)
MRAVLAHISDTVPPGVNDHLGFHAEEGPGSQDERLCVVKLVVALVPLCCQAARVGATGCVPVPSVQAVPIPETVIRLVRAELPQGLVVCYIRCEAAHLGDWQIHGRQCRHEAHEVVLPPKPTSVCRIEVHGYPRRLGGELLHGVLDALPVGLPGRLTSATRIVCIRCEVREAVGLNNNCHGEPARIRLKHLHEGVCIRLLVLPEALRAVRLVRVVAPAVRLVLTADLSI